MQHVVQDVADRSAALRLLWSASPSLLSSAAKVSRTADWSNNNIKMDSFSRYIFQTITIFAFDSVCEFNRHLIYNVMI